VRVVDGWCLEVVYEVIRARVWGFWLKRDLCCCVGEFWFYLGVGLGDVFFSFFFFLCTRYMDFDHLGIPSIYGVFSWY